MFGPSGSGKSTLLNLLSGVITPSEGEIQILGQPFSTLRGSKRDKIRAQHMGVIFQQFNLIPYLTVWENVSLACEFAKQNSQQAQNRIEALLDQLKLPHRFLSQRADQLSVGQQQRVAIARALINQPQIILADEPTSALDEDTTASFMETLIQCCDSAKCALLFVSHDHRLESFFEYRLSVQDLLSGKENDAQPKENSNVIHLGE